MILYALDRTGVEAGKALMIGDTDNDLQAAAAAGVRSCLVEWGYSLQMDQLRGSADFVISRPEQLLDLNP
jgi:phosphoglycolate phosphatase